MYFLWITSLFLISSNPDVKLLRVEKVIKREVQMTNKSIKNLILAVMKEIQIKIYYFSSIKLVKLKTMIKHPSEEDAGSLPDVQGIGGNVSTHSPKRNLCRPSMVFKNPHTCVLKHLVVSRSWLSMRQGICVFAEGGERKVRKSDHTRVCAHTHIHVIWTWMGPCLIQPTHTDMSRRHSEILPS